MTDLLHPGDVVTVRGKTLKGKNRVREMGDEWRVVETATPKQFLGDRVAIVPVSNPGLYLRFLDPLSDEHLEITDIAFA